jgi:anaerobic magnesium-protoporphyrin IX monomethyl ester cyclase
MKTILINPKFPFYRGRDLFPVGLGYLTPVAAKHGDVYVYDLNVQSVDIKKEISRIKPDFIGITSTTPSFPFARKLISDIRTISNAKIILGGLHATFCPDECLKADADIAVRGEAEKTFNEILSGKELSDIAGLSFKKDSQIVHNKDRALISDLGTIDYPLYTKFPLDKYPIMSIITSRGCPYNCSYCCATRFWKRVVRLRPEQSMIEEMKLLQSLGVDRLKIHDSTFTLNTSRVKNICEMMIDEGLKFKWSCETRADFLTEELLQIMKKAGCILICIGVDSASQRVLNMNGRHIDVETMKRAFDLAKNLDINVRAYVTFGLKGETKESVEETIKFLQDVKPFQIMLSLATIYPGTDLEGGRIVRVPEDWAGMFTGHGRLCELYLSDSLSIKEYKNLAEYMYLEVKKLIAVRGVKDEDKIHKSEAG